MHDFKKIMVAVSFNQYLEEELLYAAKLAGNLDAELLVVNVVNTRDLDAVSSISSMGYEVDGEHYVDGVRKERQKKIDDIIDASPIDRKRLTIMFKVGHPVREILKTIINENVDMVVMGAKGRTNLEEVLVGSVAEKLFRRSPVTIVSYRAGEHADRLKRRIRKKLLTDTNK